MHHSSDDRDPAHCVDGGTLGIPSPKGAANLSEYVGQDHVRILQQALHLVSDAAHVGP